jgi:hypothetical protein
VLIHTLILYELGVNAKLLRIYATDPCPLNSALALLFPNRLLEKESELLDKLFPFPLSSLVLPLNGHQPTSPFEGT